MTPKTRQGQRQRSPRCWRRADVLPALKGAGIPAVPLMRHLGGFLFHRVAARADLVLSSSAGVQPLPSSGGEDVHGGVQVTIMNSTTASAGPYADALG
jgi:hypothetical protein